MGISDFIQLMKCWPIYERQT